MSLWSLYDHFLPHTTYAPVEEWLFAVSHQLESWTAASHRP